MTAKNAVLCVCDHAALSDLLSEITLLVKSSRELIFANLQNPALNPTDLDWLPYHLLGQASALVNTVETRFLTESIPS